MNKPPKEVLEIVIGSLRNHPQDWSFSYATARNYTLNAEIWMANKYYGTRLRVGSLEWGGMTFLATFFSPFMKWRKRIVRAAEFASLRHALAMQSNPITKLKKR